MLILFFCVNTSNSQIEYQWGHSITSNANTQAYDVDVYPNGDVVSVGSISSSTGDVSFYDDDFNPSYVSSPTASTSAYVRRLNGNGTFNHFNHVVSTKPPGQTSTPNITFYDVVVCPDGGVVVVGDFKGRVDLGGSYVFTSPENGKRTSIVIVKYNAAGVFQWANSIGASNALTHSTAVSDIDVNSNNEVFVLLNFTSQIDLDKYSGAMDITSSGGKDAVIVKYLDNGNYDDNYHIKAPSENNTFMNYLKIDNNDEIYVAGLIRYDTQFDKNDPIDVTIGPSTSKDPFILKLTSSFSYDDVTIFPYSKTGSIDVRDLDVSNNSEPFIIVEFYNAQLTVDPNDLTQVREESSSMSGDAMCLIQLDDEGDYKMDKFLLASVAFLSTSAAYDDLGEIHIVTKFKGDISNHGGPSTISTGPKYDLGYFHFDEAGAFIESVNLIRGDDDNENIGDIAIVNSTGDLYIAGQAESSDLDMDPINAGEQDLEYGSSSEIAFTARYQFTSILPVDQIILNAFLKDTYVQLDWEVLSEKGVSEYVVEKSTDASNWEDMIAVNSLGDNPSSNYYTSIDRDFVAGLVYYRIKYVDYDGKIGYSNIQLIMKESNELTLFPNPASNVINISGNDLKNKSFAIFNSLGTQVHRGAISNITVTSVELSHFPMGVYIVRIEGNNSTHRFVKH